MTEIQSTASSRGSTRLRLAQGQADNAGGEEEADKRQQQRRDNGHKIPITKIIGRKSDVRRYVVQDALHMYTIQLLIHIHGL